MSLFNAERKIKVNNYEIINRLNEEVELIELTDNYGNTKPIFDEDFQELYKYINDNVISTYIENREVLYIDEFYLELKNGGQAMIKIL